MKLTPIQPGPNQESVWDYPRPAIAEAISDELRVEFAGRTLAETRSGVRTLETSHPPTYYIPRAHVDTSALVPNGRRSLCEWKGQANYRDIAVDGDVIEAGAWSYPSPTLPFAAIRDFLAFYPDPLDECLIDRIKITPQPGQF